MEDEHGPEEVINGMPLNVATPFSSVKRFCTHKNVTESLPIGEITQYDTT